MPTPGPLHVAASFPLWLTGGSHSHICLSLCEHLRSPEVEVTLHAPAVSPGARRSFTRVAAPASLLRLAYRLDAEGRLPSALHRAAYRRALRRADLAYLWAATPEATYRDVADAGVPLCVERINCHRATARRILDEAYRRAGLPPGHGITEEALAEERRKLARADWIFAPSPAVRRSLLDDGVPERKVLLASYGWSPERMAVAAPERRGDGPPTFLFAGTVCVRKGAHLLLDAWRAAGVAGRLALAGALLPEVAQAAGDALRAPGVALLGHVPDVARVYAGAHAFAFPTLEEGSPLVSYEAMAHGLPVITTPMGAGELVRDGVEGLVCEPYDREAWVAAIRRLAGDPALRARLGAAARARAARFTWREVAARRRSQLLEALAGRRDGARAAPVPEGVAHG